MKFCISAVAYSNYYQNNQILINFYAIYYYNTLENQYNSFVIKYFDTGCINIVNEFSDR